MAGVCVSGVLWAIFQNNAGGAWDNAKKSFEAGVEIDGEMTYKGSDAHKAAVTGDTVGDPFKDTSGPSMNILIKLTCLVGLVIAPILAQMAGGHGNNGSDGTCPAKYEKAHCKKDADCAEYKAHCKGKKSCGEKKDCFMKDGKCMEYKPECRGKKECEGKAECMQEVKCCKKKCEGKDKAECKKACEKKEESADVEEEVEDESTLDAETEE